MEKNSKVKAIEKATGVSWEEWLSYLDQKEAKKLSHKEIALLAYEKLKPIVESWGWWGQAVTVAYEQHIGRRVEGQRSDGTFEVSISRATKRSMEDLMDRWKQFAETDARLKELISTEPRLSGTSKRLSWRAKAVDGYSLHVVSEPKKSEGASLIITLSSIENRSSADNAREVWKEILERFVHTV